MDKENENYDYKSVILTSLAYAATEDGVTDRIRELRFSALKDLTAILNHYEKLGYMDELICKIAEKKTKMILSATSRQETKKLLKPSCPRYDGVKFVTDQYNVPEEELICWSETSLVAPLNEAGFKRYMEVFKTIFPEKSKQIFEK